MKLKELTERLRNDDADYEGLNPHSWGLTEYLKTVLEDGNFANDAAVGSAKRAIEEGVSSLTDNQLRAIALDIINNEVYMSECPNEWCGEGVAWGDMKTALWEGQCYHCVNQKKKIDRE